ncbi:MAG: hypothetical protein ACAH24_15015 [Hyphomicrobiaceae bacterium]
MHRTDRSSALDELREVAWLSGMAVLLSLGAVAAAVVLAFLVLGP